MTDFLDLKDRHVLITGALGGIGSAAVDEFLGQGCFVTAVDIRPPPDSFRSRLHHLQCNISKEDEVESCMHAAVQANGPIHVLVANAGITDESRSWPLWQMPVELWQKVYNINVLGTMLSIKHFLRCAETWQNEHGKEMDHLAIVVTGSETGVFGQAGHSEYASGKAGLQYGLVKGVKNEIVQLNRRARINAVAPGWVDTALIGDRLDDPSEMWAEAQATVPLRKIAKPQDVARTMAFLASNRAAGHITGACVSVDGGMEGRLLWRPEEVGLAAPAFPAPATASVLAAPNTTAKKITIALSIDVDAVSSWLGTGQHPENTMADYSQGVFAGEVGVPRLLRLVKKLGIQDKVTWFIPAHSMETFPEEIRKVIDSGCEIGLHGYSHEGAYQMTVDQERDVLDKSISVLTQFAGKKPVGYRAPLYQIRESTLSLLEERGILYDSSFTHRDCVPYKLPGKFQTTVPDFSQQAETWMVPSRYEKPPVNIVEIPGNWYTEDATPLQYYPHSANSHGYVDVRLIEQNWKDRFNWLAENMEDEGDEDGVVFPVLLHPDTSGMPHIIGMIERFLKWAMEQDNVEFSTHGAIARRFLASSKESQQ